MTTLDQEIIKKAIEARRKTEYPAWKVKEIMKNMNRKLPDIGTNPNKIYRNWIQAGLQPDKFKNKEELFETLKKILNTQKGVDGKKKITMAEALLQVFPEGYKGIPLEMQYKGSISGGTRNVTNVVFDKRRFREAIPLEVNKYFKMQEDLGVFPQGTLAKYEKYIAAGNERNRKLAVRLSKLTGIKFDKGHIYGLFNKIGEGGGSHDPAAQIAELLSENRGKGLDNIPKELAASLDIPPNWQQSALEFVHRDTGGLSGSQLPVNKLTGKTLSDSDLGKVTRLDFSPDQVVANKWKQIHDAITEAEIAKTNGKLPDWVTEFNKRITPAGEYIQKVGDVNPKSSNTILKVIAGNVIKNPYVKNAAKYVVPAAGLVISNMNRAGVAAEYEANPNKMNLVRKRIAEGQVALETADTATLGATGAVTWFPNLLGDAAEYTLKTLQKPPITEEERKLEMEKQVGANFSTL